ncbi:electron transport complex subunit E [Thiomicrospira cyclica]|uniref:Ion-translocating oxidoreductase complex subunit E n=1 Tax=Thiomicrospira cyclica (strain DSM 14477 / JCM 11371 / ALM1) TaxID=717773 RepID=F6DBW8_THICA|nr:electron transport complex subunit E [Thiomicrospira cyclica]AEG31354.1 Electron transport complex protein rnfE [Thiomicrospira cyclica ALM1]
MSSSMVSAWQQKWADYQDIAQKGLWNNNQALVALLGLCPLLAVTNNTVNGLGLGLATMAVLLTSNILVSLIRDYVPTEIRIPVFIAIIACAVTVIDMLMHAYFYTLHGILGIFIPLIVTNCAILARAEAFASKNPVDKSIVDALFIGVGFTLVLIVLGAIRELIGNGTLFDQAWLLFGDTAQNWVIYLPENFNPVMLAILPPGAFIALGLLIALKNLVDQKVRKPSLANIAVELKPAK